METRAGRLRGTSLGQPWESGQGHGPPEHGSPSLSLRTTPHRQGGRWGGFSGRWRCLLGSTLLSSLRGWGGHGTPLSVFLLPGLLT